MRWLWVLPLLWPLTSCVAGPEARPPRSLVDAWREAGAVLPAGRARTTYDRLAADAAAHADRLRAAERDAFDALATAGERHDAGRDALYAPLGALAERRRAILRDYAATRLAMRHALTPAQWADVVRAVAP